MEAPYSVVVRIKHNNLVINMIFSQFQVYIPLVVVLFCCNRRICALHHRKRCTRIRGVENNES